MKRRYPFPYSSGPEPTLNELLNCPVMHALLASDKLTVSDVRIVVQDWHQSRKSSRTQRLWAAA